MKIHPSAESVLCILQRCRKEKTLAYAKHALVYDCHTGLQNPNTVGNYIVPMFVGCGSVSDAQRAFNSLASRNEYSWTALLSGYIEGGDLQHGLSLYVLMQQDNIGPSRFTLLALLKACAKLKDLEKGRRIHLDILESGLEGDVFVGNTLVDLYSKCGSLEEATQVFDILPVLDVVSWNALVAGFVEKGCLLEALKCYEHMHLEGTYPDAVTFLLMLKVCCIARSIHKGREIHVQIGQEILGKDTLVGNTLLDMYAKCGSLSEMQVVFDTIPFRDVVSWNAIIVGFFENGLDLEAMKCLVQMELERVAPNAFTFVCCLKACGAVVSLDKGREIHSKISKRGLERDAYVGSTLIDMYFKCGSLIEAQGVFNKLPIRNVTTWTALIAGYAESCCTQEAFKCYGEMQLGGVIPDAVTYICILKACTKIGAIEMGREIHTDLRQKGLDVDPFVGTSLIDMYAKCSSPAEAQGVFDSMLSRNCASWNALIAGYAENGLDLDALKCLKQMQHDGACLDSATLIPSLKACGNTGAIDKGREIHNIVVQKGLEKENRLGSSLVDMYAKCGMLAEAEDVFYKLSARDCVSYNALILGYAEFRRGQKALSCFEQMKQETVVPNAVTYISALKACAGIGAIDKGRGIHMEIAGSQFRDDLFIGNILVDMYARCGSLTEARHVFDKLPMLDIVSWNAMIRGYGVNNEVNMAIECFEGMQKDGVMADAVTFTCLITACSRASLLFRGKYYFQMMREEYGIAPTIDHYTCIIDLLARAGHLYEAEKFLGYMPNHTSTETWTTLLSACKTYGQVELGQRCFELLLQINPKNAALYMFVESI